MSGGSRRRAWKTWDCQQSLCQAQGGLPQRVTPSPQPSPTTESRVWPRVLSPEAEADRLSEGVEGSGSGLCHQTLFCPGGLSLGPLVGVRDLRGLQSPQQHGTPRLLGQNVQSPFAKPWGHGPGGGGAERHVGAGHFCRFWMRKLGPHGPVPAPRRGGDQEEARDSQGTEPLRLGRSPQEPRTPPWSSELGRGRV